MFGYTRRSIVRSLAVAAIMVAVLASPLSAFAAAGPWDSVELTLIQPSGQAVLLISGKLPAKAKLPAAVSLAIPAGSQMQWAGEIVGTDPSKDPTVEYEVQKGEKYDLVTFTLTQARTGQVEVLVPNNVVKKGSASTASIDWVAPYDVPSLLTFIEVHAGATVAAPPKGAKKESSGGATYYSLPAAPVKSGDRIQFAVDYTGGNPSAGGATGGAAPGAQPGVPPATGAPTTGGSNNNLLLGLVAVGALIGALFLVMQRNQAAAQAAQDAEEDEVEPESVIEGARIAVDDDDEYDPFAEER